MELPLLQQREIEARILAPVIESLIQQFGRDSVLSNVSETVKTLAAESGRELADAIGSNTLHDLAQVLEIWKNDGALEIDMLNEDDTQFNFNVTRCRFAEMYHQLGIPELGPILSCNRDFCFAQGFNSKMKLTRTQTIMEGASHCDFRFQCKSETQKKKEDHHRAAENAED